MTVSKEIFRELNELALDKVQKSESKANNLRKLLEKALIIRLSSASESYLSLKYLFDDYIDKFHPEGIKYTGRELIKILNAYSHFTDKTLSQTEFQNIVRKTNKILEIILGTNNVLPIDIVSEENHGSLNPDQIKAIISISRFTLVNAGPGTGKTHLIVYRIIESARENNSKRIIGLAYTNQAADNLRTRLKYQLFGTDDTGLLDNLFIGTIHSFALDSLKRYSKEILNTEYEYSIIDKEEEESIERDFNHNKEAIGRYLSENKLLTFDEILNAFKKELSDNDNFTKYLTKSICEIIIDEAQDISPRQYELLSLLYRNSDHLKLYFVGDQRQNIFDFLNGTLKNMEKYFRDVQITEYPLKESYRCPDNILKFVNTLIFSDSNNIELKNPEYSGDKPDFERAESKEHESEFITGLIKGYIGNGITLDSMVVLSPSSFYFDCIGKTLNSQQIPFKIIGGETFLKSEIRFLVNLLKCVRQQKTYSLLKVIAFLYPASNVTGKTFSEIITNRELLDVKELRFIQEFITSHLNSGPDIQPIIRDFIDQWEEQHFQIILPTDLFEEFLLLLRDKEGLTIESIDSLLNPNTKELDRYFYRSSDIKYEFEMKKDFLTLSTIHSAKGFPA